MYKFLLVEDSLSDVEAFQTTIKRMNRGNGQTIYELVIAESVDKAMEMIDSTYNGAIIDINRKRQILRLPLNLTPLL